MKELETKRLMLRKWTLDDIQQAFDNWASDEKMHEYVNWTLHKDIENTRELITDWINNYDKGAYNWVVILKETNELIGCISIGRVNKRHNTCDLGYCYGSKYWGNGYGTEALRSVIEYLLLEENFHLVEAAHLSNNPASGRIMQKAGMHKDAELRERRLSNGKYYSLIWYSILKEEL